MDTSKTSFPDISVHPRVIKTLAVIGFIALIGVGMWFAIYSTRFVPSVINRVGTAAVYLGSVFSPAEEPELSVIPTASTTISFGTASSTAPVSTVDKPIVPNNQKKTETTAGSKTSNTYQISGTTNTLYGLPDLIVDITDIGYLATTSAESFVASSTVPSGSRPAVVFIIKNVGTNIAGAWRFSASIPTQTSYIYQSQVQQQLAPGDSIEYTLGFDQAIKGSDKMISITANFDHAVGESNTNNNSDSAKITILGN